MANSAFDVTCNYYELLKVDEKANTKETIISTNI